ncbi:uncharacterized protein LOC111339482 isoform X2 [Stylophora pistillata]|uniref:uncharacterized protein LOC111339482 isoform X2 n=1 Tax=Stylophora pistillata TaxID=50429 RepID=UPI000C056486|nr:uncharacterized protein LOC111339482 isoform X2 [Stylophora pistillata]
MDFEASQQFTSELQNPDYWRIVEGQFGDMLVGQDGDIMLEASTWKCIQEKLNEPTFKDLLQTLGKKMEKCSDPQRLVSQPVFKEFIESNSPKLFKIILDSILSEHHGEKRADLQEQRATAVIWQLLYYRNQRHDEFLDESSILLELHGLQSSGMAPGKVLGFARDDGKTNTQKRHSMASSIAQYCI